jgi:MinD superfamily P-loop ATPase
MNIVISSGKGGTGKTLVATNLAAALEERGIDVAYLDCDVEEPNGHLFLKPQIDEEEELTIRTPVGIDQDKCTSCGRCSEACRYNAIAIIKDKALFFPELCHACGACSIVCPEEAIIEKDKKIGVASHGHSGGIQFHHAMLQTAAGGMSPRLVKEVKKRAIDGINILDSSPGTACPVAEAVNGADLVILVTDPTPFGINDLKLAAKMVRVLGIEPLVLVNRTGFDQSDLMEYCEEAGLDILAEIPDDRRIAEVYSRGDLIIDYLPEYKDLFLEISRKVEKAVKEERPVKEPGAIKISGEKATSINLAQQRSESGSVPRELVIISGKGGTGKTSLAGAFAALAEKGKLADCDVDAPDLHLLLDPEVVESGPFVGGVTARIDQEKCTACGACFRECRFEAINGTEDGYEIDPVACEGCGVCGLVCKFGAIDLKEAVNGQWFVSRTRFGPMAHAELGMAEENSGRLVTIVRQKAAELSGNGEVTVVDGAPGTGCPVIASISGSKYALVVTEPTVAGLHDMIRVLDVTTYFGVPSGIVINKCDLNENMANMIETKGRTYGAEILGKIPYDSVVTEAQMRALTVIEHEPDCDVSRRIQEIWGHVQGRMTS